MFDTKIGGTVVTKLKQNNLRLRSLFEIEMPLWRRRQSFRYILVITVYASKLLIIKGLLKLTYALCIHVMRCNIFKNVSSIRSYLLSSWFSGPIFAGAKCPRVLKFCRVRFPGFRALTSPWRGSGFPISPCLGWDWAPSATRRRRRRREEKHRSCIDL